MCCGARRAGGSYRPPPRPGWRGVIRRSFSSHAVNGEFHRYNCDGAVVANVSNELLLQLNVIHTNTLATLNGDSGPEHPRAEPILVTMAFILSTFSAVAVCQEYKLYRESEKGCDSVNLIPPVVVSHALPVLIKSITARWVSENQLETRFHQLSTKSSWRTRGSTSHTSHYPLTVERVECFSRVRDPFR